MPYRFRKQEPVADAVRRMAAEQIERAVGEINDPELDPHETVHQVRKRCKKVRGLIRLVRPRLGEYQRENKFFRDWARQLSYVRDAQSLVETFDALREHFSDQVDASAFASLRDRLTRRRAEVAEDEVGLDRRLEELLWQMQEARQRVQRWSIRGAGFDCVAGGLAKTYRRGCRAMKQAHRDASTENLHEWRKRAKYHWYHARLLRSIWKPVMTAHRQAASELADCLGDDHDLAILRAQLSEDPEAFGRPRDIEAWAGLIDTRRAELRRRAGALARRLYAEKPKHLVRRFGRYWQAWRGATAPLPPPEPPLVAADSK